MTNRPSALHTKAPHLLESDKTAPAPRLDSPRPHTEFQGHARCSSR
ncbi:Uncharacterised protein [Vibrio cholerae]|nr:Uncharacterised protein [Vibrio cholerae]